MAAWLAPATARLTFKTRLEADTGASNVYQTSFDYSLGSGSAGDQSDRCTDLAAAMETGAMAAALEAAMPAIFSYFAASVYIMNDDSQLFSANKIFTSSHVGAITAGVLDSGLAACISKYAARVGPFYRGRNYITGIKLSATVEGVIHADQFTALTALAAVIVAPFTSGGVVYTPIITHKGTPPTFSFVKFAGPKPIARYIRRRQHGRGS